MNGAWFATSCPQGSHSRSEPSSREVDFLQMFSSTLQAISRLLQRAVRYLRLECITRETCPPKAEQYSQTPDSTRVDLLLSRTWHEWRASPPTRRPPRGKWRRSRGASGRRATWVVRESRRGMSRSTRGAPSRAGCLSSIGQSVYRARLGTERRGRWRAARGMALRGSTRPPPLPRLQSARAQELRAHNRRYSSLGALRWVVDYLCWRWSGVLWG